MDSSTSVSQAHNQDLPAFCANVLTSIEAAKHTLYAGGSCAIESDEFRDQIFDMLDGPRTLVVDQLLSMPPTTTSGLVALARAIVTHSPHLVEARCCETLEERLIRVLLQQLLIHDQPVPAAVLPAARSLSPEDVKPTAEVKSHEVELHDWRLGEAEYSGLLGDQARPAEFDVSFSPSRIMLRAKLPSGVAHEFAFEMDEGVLNFHVWPSWRSPNGLDHEVGAVQEEAVMHGKFGLRRSLFIFEAAGEGVANFAFQHAVGVLEDVTDDSVDAILRAEKMAASTSTLVSQSSD
jgi:hypothetical protein